MLIDAQSDLELVGTAQDILDVLDEAKSNCPDLVIVDWEMLGRQLDALPDFIELLDGPLRIVVMSVNEGAQATNTGSFSDIDDGDTDLLCAPMKKSLSLAPTS